MSDKVDQILSTYIPAVSRKRNVRRREAVREVAKTTAKQQPAKEVVTPEPSVVVVQFPDNRFFINGTNTEVKLERHFMDGEWRWFHGSDVRIVKADRYGRVGEKLEIEGDTARWVKTPPRPLSEAEKIKAMPFLLPIQPPPPEPEKPRDKSGINYDKSRYACPNCSPGHKAPDCTGACEVRYGNR